MQSVKLKICGLRDNAGQVAGLRPDYAGFIFYNKSPRYVGDDYVLPQSQFLGIDKVGVFVDESMEKMAFLAKKYQLDYMQLHGHESAECCAQLKEQGWQIIKAFAVDEAFDFQTLKPYEDSVDYFLFDTKTAQYGGSGKTFDWTVLRDYASKKPFFLSGGIGLDNVAALEALNLDQLHALDVNSKFEVRPGMKDVDALHKLIRFMEKRGFLARHKENS